MPDGRLRIALRPRAEADVADAIDHYLLEAGADVADSFGTALARAYALIGANPGIGSPRYADAVGIPSLRTWAMRPWPYVLFYVHSTRSVDVIRVLHASRDIPATLAGLEP